MREHLDQTREEPFDNWPPVPACLGCGHYRPLWNHGDGRLTGMVCHYLLDEGHSRGCPAGENCRHHPAASASLNEKVKVR